MKYSNSFHKKLVVAFLSAIVIWGCNSDDDNTTPDNNDDDIIDSLYLTGAFVINEGNFGGGNGDVTYYSPAGDTTVDLVFKKVNGDFAGDVLQSIAFKDTLAYLVVNGDSKIEVVSLHTFTHQQTLTSAAMDKPRYLSIINNKAYVSVWGPYDENYALINSYILVFNLTSGAVVDTIDTDEGVERMVYDGEHLFASNFNYGSSNTLAIIDPDDNSLVDQLELSAGPNGLVLDANDKLWVICGGTYEGNDGVIYGINTTTFAIEDSIALGFNPNTDLTITPDKQTLVYHNGNAVYKMSITADEAPSTPAFTASDVTYTYSLDVDPATGDIYIGDAQSFEGPGTVYIYSPTGTLKNSFTAGIGPTEVLFR